MKTAAALAGAWALFVLTAAAAGPMEKIQPGEELIENKEGAELRVPGVEPTDERIGRLKRPTGFRIAKLADGLGKPRMFAVGDDGTLYVTRCEPGDVLALRDTDGDRRIDRKEAVVKNLPHAHGIVLHGGKM